MITLLEGTAHYAGLLLALAEDFSRGFFLPSDKTSTFCNQAFLNSLPIISCLESVTTPMRNEEAARLTLAIVGHVAYTI